MQPFSSFKDVSIKDLKKIFTSVDKLPPASLSYCNKILRLKGGKGIEDILYACLKNSNNVYEWKQINANDKIKVTDEFFNFLITGHLNFRTLQYLQLNYRNNIQFSLNFRNNQVVTFGGINGG
jgi:hypothetical protein